ncbi:MAG: hypothetical protein EKK53_15180 [Burkholderiales bacterium]|nr:MAG: hypothetical protein EKK53_15180 [Burkholderiales bacterium]
MTTPDIAEAWRLEHVFEAELDRLKWDSDGGGASETKKVFQAFHAVVGPLCDELERLRAQVAEPFWYAVISQRAPIVDKAIRREDFAREYADQVREGNPYAADVEVVPLYRAAPAQQAEPLFVPGAMTGMVDAQVASMWPTKAQQAEPDWLHLKAYGYAPGNYMSRCFRCNGTFAGLDKRATSCRACAEKLHAKQAAASQPPVQHKDAD